MWKHVLSCSDVINVPKCAKDSWNVAFITCCGWGGLRWGCHYTEELKVLSLLKSGTWSSILKGSYCVPGHCIWQNVHFCHIYIVLGGARGKSMERFKFGLSLSLFGVLIKAFFSSVLSACQCMWQMQSHPPNPHYPLPHQKHLSPPCV